MRLQSRSKVFLQIIFLVLIVQVIHAETSTEAERRKLFSVFSKTPGEAPVDVDLRREEEIEENVGKPLFRSRYEIRVEEIETANGPTKKVVLFINHTKCRLQVTGKLEHEYTTYTDARIVNGPNGAYSIPGSSSTQSNLTYPVSLQVGLSSFGCDGIAILYVNDMKAMLPIMPNIARLKVKIFDDEKTIIQNYKLGDGSQTSLEEAFRAEKLKADSGDPASAFKVALIYKYGDFVYTDATLYESYTNMSSAREYVPGQTEQAQILLNPVNSTAIRTRNALALAQRSADEGDANALLLLGCCYDYFPSQGAQGIKQDLDQAVYWYKKSAERGNRIAMSDLGYLFEHDFPAGSKFHRNILESQAWYKKAADHGDPVARFHLQDGLPAQGIDR